MPLISKLVGKGVALGAEYREHRKEVKLSRESSQQSVEQGPSTSPQLSRNTSATTPNDAPPSYQEAAGQNDSQTLQSGKAASEDKKAALAQYQEHDEDESDSDDTLSTEDDEADWELDEAVSSRDSAPPEYRAVDDLVHDVLTTTNATSDLPTDFERTPLPCPVILPQRRPRKKERGFVRAYAPLLGECSGIDQATFLAFLENFHESSQASPVWSVIQISAAIAGFAPSPIAMAVTTAAQIAAKTAKEVQGRHRANDFLDKMNESLFKPAGLFAMIVKYKTTDEVARSENSIFRRLGIGAEQINFNTGEAVAKYDRSLSGGEERTMGERMKNLRLASGTTRGAIELPAAAPLVFPEVDKMIVAQGPETFKDRAKDAKAFMADYMDRRAQMEYAQSDPNSTLSVPQDKKTMKSAYADPNHAMYNGGLISLVSGGHLGKGASRTAGFGRPEMYDSSRLYNSGDHSYRDARRHDRNERRALRTEQRMAQGRRVGRKREGRYEDFLYEQEAMYGGDAGFGVRGAGRRGRGRGGLIGGLVGAVSEARSGASNPPAPYGGSGAEYNPPAPYGASGQPGSSSNPPAPYGSSSSTPAGSHALYSGRRSRGRRQKGGPLGLVKRVMQEDVLYLMIVNLPSEEELAKAREAIEAAKNA